MARTMPSMVGIVGRATAVDENVMFFFTARRVCIARTMPWQDVCLRPSVRRYTVETAKHIEVFSPRVARPF